MTYVAVAAGVIAAVGAAATYVNNRNTANRQDATLAASLRQQGQEQTQANQQVNQLIQKTASSNATGPQQTLMDQFTAQLKRNQGNADAGLGQVGNVSDAYTKASNDAASGIADYGNTRAGLISAIDAPGLQRQQEGENLTKYTTALNQIGMASNDANFLAQMKLRAIQPNAGLTALAGISNGVASGLASYGAGGGAGGTGTGAGYLDGGGATYGGYNLPYKTA